MQSPADADAKGTKQLLREAEVTCVDDWEQEQDVDNGGRRYRRLRALDDSRLIDARLFGWWPAKSTQNADHVSKQGWWEARFGGRSCKSKKKTTKTKEETKESSRPLTTVWCSRNAIASGGSKLVA